MKTKLYDKKILVIGRHLSELVAREHCEIKFVSMKALAKTIRNPHKFIYKHFYSTASDKKGGKMNLELSDIPTEEEIELEVGQ